MPPDLNVVEIMTDGETEEAVIECLIEAHTKIGMLPVKVRKESTGFVMNRIWDSIKRECLMVLGEGKRPSPGSGLFHSDSACAGVSTPSEIDALFQAFFGSRAGPCAMMDSVGLDTVAAIEDNYIEERHLSGQYTVDPLRKDYISQGKLGAKSGKGGLYPAGHTTRPVGADTSHHDNLAAPMLYLLDLGFGGNNELGVTMLNKGQVILGSSDGRSLKTLVDSCRTPDGIDIHLPTGRMIWTSMGIPSKNDGCVFSANLDGSDVKTIVPPGAVHTPKQLVIDQVNGMVYFSDREGLRVMRCKLDGSGLETIIQTGDWNDASQSKDELRWCVGVAVDPEAGVFYWSQKGPSKGGAGRILRASMAMPSNCSASTRPDIEVLFDKLPEVIDLELDIDSQTLYWTDRGEFPLGNTLSRAHVGDIVPEAQGEIAKEIITRHFHEAIGVKLDKINKHIYVADLGGAVYRMDMDGSQKTRVYDTERCFTGIGLSHVG